MFVTSIRRFLSDEAGGYTVWSLVWFSLYVAMGGLAVDITDAYRNQTMLQSTADASALAGVLSLPDQGDAVNQAVSYSFDNMAYRINGAVLDRDEVFFGKWDFVAQTFTPDTVEPNAVRVITRRDDTNRNPLAANFLRIMSLFGIPFDRFNISVEAIAVTYISDCVDKNGLIAGNKVDVTSGNSFYQICVHGDNNVEDPGKDLAIDLNINNFYDVETVEVSFPEPDDINDRPNLCEKNADICDTIYVTGEPWDRPELDFVDDVIFGLLDGGVDQIGTAGPPDPQYVPWYIGQEPGDSDPSSIADNVIEIVNGENYTGTFLPGNIYRIRCTNKTNPINLPTSGVNLERMVIVTDCSINASNALSIADVLIASSAVGSGNGNQNPAYPFTSIHLASDAAIGSLDFCDADNYPGSGATGQVSIYALASAQVAANTVIRGLEIRVLGDFQLAAGTDAEGISAIAGHDIFATAGGSYTYCGGEFDSLVKIYEKRLVR